MVRRLFLLSILLSTFTNTGATEGDNRENLNPSDCRPQHLETHPECLGGLKYRDVKFVAHVHGVILDGYFVHAKHDFEACGFKWPKDTKFRISEGEVAEVFFQKPIKYNGLTIFQARFGKFCKHLPVEVLLGAPSEINGYKWPKNSNLYFTWKPYQEKSRLSHVILGNKLTVDKTVYPLGQVIWFNDSGKIDLSAPKPNELLK